MDFAGFGGFGGFDALDALAGAGQTVLPIAVGAATTFGVAEAVNLLVTSPKVRKWKWVMGVGASLLAGLGMYQKSPEDGYATMAGGLLAGLVAFGHEQIVKYQIKKGTDLAFMGRRGRGRGNFGRYVVQPSQDLFAGRYVTSPADPLLAGLDQSDYVSLGNMPSPAMATSIWGSG